jgi:two-component system CitB family sensor kinase
MTDLGVDLIFEVEDQGPGISAEEEARMFDKGVTSKTDSGHGIGLYLVRQFVERWGGSITVENLAPCGSRFTLYLPKQPLDPEGAG